MNALTPSHRAVLAAVNAWSWARSYQPSLRELSQTSGLPVSTLKGYLGALVEAGLVQHEPHQPRTLRLGPRVAGSRNGHLAFIVTTFRRCIPCGHDVPAGHECPPKPPPGGPPLPSKEIAVSSEPITVSVHPAGLLLGDRLLRDPDAPERRIEWRIGRLTSRGTGVDRVVIADYVTEDGTEGTHGFEDPLAWLIVAAVRTGEPAEQAA